MAHEQITPPAKSVGDPGLLFLGSSDSKGVPRIGCTCPICRHAKPGTRNYRSRSALVLTSGSKHVLVDTPPELRVRLTEEQLPLPNALFLTHPHNDHILGFGDAVDAIRLTHHSCPIYAPEEVFSGLRERFGYLWTPPRDLSLYRPLNGPVTEGDWTLEAVRVNHGFNGWSYGYLIERDTWRCGYFPDALAADDTVRKRWQGLNLLILGANHWKEEAPLEQRSVYDVQEAVAEAEEAGVERLILTHLSHAVDFDSHSGQLPEWASLAYDGRRVSATNWNHTTYISHK